MVELLPRDIARFWKYTTVGSDCWLWFGPINPDGYARLHLHRNGNTYGCGAHRIAYTLLVGPIPDGMQLDHLCRTRNCVNPAHLDPVPNKTNVLRGSGITAINARKTHCIDGHPFDEANTYWRRHKYGIGRACRKCAHDKRVERKRVRRAVEGE